MARELEGLVMVRGVRAPCGLLDNRRKREAFEEFPEGHTSQGSATLGFRRALGALSAFPVDVRKRSDTSSGTFGFLVSAS